MTLVADPYDFPDFSASCPVSNEDCRLQTGETWTGGPAPSHTMFYFFRSAMSSPLHSCRDGLGMLSCYFPTRLILLNIRCARDVWVGGCECPSNCRHEQACRRLKLHPWDEACRPIIHTDTDVWAMVDCAFIIGERFFSKARHSTSRPDGLAVSARVVYFYVCMCMRCSSVHRDFLGRILIWSYCKRNAAGG